MSPLFEQVLVFVVMSVLVTLFTWIYVSQRRREFRLWLLGWSAISVHFAAPVVGHLLPSAVGLTHWISVISLIVAGTFFLLSVSQVFRNPRERLIFVTMIALAASLYFTGLDRGISTRWVYIVLLAASTLSGLYQGIRFYGLRNLHLLCIVGVLFPFSCAAIWEAFHGNLHLGLEFYLFGLFYVTGLSYFRFFQRRTPGVIFTSPGAWFSPWALTW
jgi:hypothetical protein